MSYRVHKLASTTNITPSCPAVPNPEPVRERECRTANAHITLRPVDIPLLPVVAGKKVRTGGENFIFIFIS